MKIQAEAEASRRRTMSDAEAYAIRQTSLAQFENLKREVELIETNPTWVNKTLAEKLGDKVQVIVMPNLTADILGKEAGKRVANGQSRSRPGRPSEAAVRRPRGSSSPLLLALLWARFLARTLSSTGPRAAGTSSSSAGTSRRTTRGSRSRRRSSRGAPPASGRRGRPTPGPRFSSARRPSASRRGRGAAPEGVAFAAVVRSRRSGRRVRVYDGEAFRRVLDDVPAGRGRDRSSSCASARSRERSARASRCRAQTLVAKWEETVRVADVRRVRPDAARRRGRLAQARACGARPRAPPPRGGKRRGPHGARPPADRREPAARGPRAGSREGPPPARRRARRPAPPGHRSAALSPGGLAHARAWRAAVVRIEGEIGALALVVASAHERAGGGPAPRRVLHAPAPAGARLPRAHGRSAGRDVAGGRDPDPPRPRRVRAGRVGARRPSTDRDIRAGSSSPRKPSRPPRRTGR